MAVNLDTIRKIGDTHLQVGTAVVKHAAERSEVDMPKLEPALLQMLGVLFEELRVMAHDREDTKTCNICRREFHGEECTGCLHDYLQQCKDKLGGVQRSIIYDQYEVLMGIDKLQHSVDHHKSTIEDLEKKLSPQETSDDGPVEVNKS